VRPTLNELLRIGALADSDFQNPLTFPFEPVESSKNMRFVVIPQCIVFMEKPLAIPRKCFPQAAHLLIVARMRLPKCLHGRSSMARLIE
jgi:hypothetical protein